MFWVLAAQSFKSIPVDAGHNFDNHGLPTTMNVLTIAQCHKNRPHEQAEMDLDALVCAAAIHDRQRTVLGHVPGSFLARQILQEAGASDEFQDKVIKLIDVHSDMERVGEMTLEEKILVAADKLEYLEPERAKSSAPNLNKFSSWFYKKYWSKRSPDAVNFLRKVSPELGIEEMLENYLKRLGEYVNNSRKDLIEIYDGLSN